MKKLVMELFKSNHDTKVPVDGYIFEEDIKDITAIDDIEITALKNIWKAAWKYHKLGELGWFDLGSDNPLFPEYPWELSSSNIEIDIYVNRFSGFDISTLISTLNICRDKGLDVTLYFLNSTDGTYWSLEVR